MTKIENNVAPFIKWVGGKRSLLDEISSRFPKKIKNYYEPFLGGGAVYYKICKLVEGKCFLSDLNRELITTFNVVKNNLEDLIKELETHKANHCRNYYYSMRNQRNQKSPICTAARFIYLNKTCYNGLYRVNKKGDFNVSLIDEEGSRIVQKDVLEKASKALKGSSIEVKDFESISPEKGDFVYFDPPYLSEQDSNLIGYNSNVFTKKDHLRLRDFVIELSKKGVNVMLSNSYTKFLIDIYKNFNVEKISTNKSFNRSKKRLEILVTNY